jgi:4-hydroxy-2-oxoheptanedioate aldolase
MEIPVNTFKRAIRAGKPQIGLWCSLCSPYAVEIVAGSGFDWLLIDAEHSPNDLPLVTSQLQAALGSPSHPIVRPPWNDMVLIKQYLDAGAQTLLVPYVQTEEEARRAVASTRYPPQGVRGVAGTTRATRFGRVNDYFARAAEETCVLVQIETRLGLDNLEAIARVEGVDGVFVGPADLAAGLGHLGDIAHPEVQSAIDDAIRRIRACGKAPGFITGDEALARRYLELGCLFVAVGQDIVLLARGTEKLAATFKPLPNP